MSFSFSFFATSRHSAADQLAAIGAPTLIKALIDKALDGMPWPRQASVSPSGGYTDSTNSTKRKPAFVGAHVEAWGHIDDGTGGTSDIQKFLVRPLFE